MLHGGGTGLEATDDVLAKSALCSYKVLTDGALKAITQVHTAAGHDKSNLSQYVGRSSMLEMGIACLSRDCSRSSMACLGRG